MECILDLASCSFRDFIGHNERHNFGALHVYNFRRYNKFYGRIHRHTFIEPMRPIKVSPKNKMEKKDRK